MEETEKKTFSQWGVLEVMGHQTFCGHISEEIIAGQPFLRVDVPETECVAAFTKFVGASSVYAITPTTEDYARRAAAGQQKRPLTLWLPEVPEEEPFKLLEAGDDPDEYDYDPYRDRHDETDGSDDLADGHD